MLQNREIVIEIFFIISVSFIVLVLIFILFRIFRQEKSYNREDHIRDIDSKVDLLYKTLNNIQEKLGTNISNNIKTEEHLKNMGERLAIIDRAQGTFDLLSERVTDLQNILSNKQLRGAFGEVQLENLVRDSLPYKSYEFQKTLNTGSRVDCIIKLESPPGPLCIDSKFPLEHYRSYVRSKNEVEKKRYLKDFGLTVLKHINDISEKYLVPGETGDVAIMFIPSESIYAEINIKLPEIIKKSREKKVVLCGPDNLMLMLNTITGILRNASMNEAAEKIQIQVNFLLKDLERLSERVNKLKTHFHLAQKDLNEIETSEEKITRRGLKINSIDVDDDSLEVNDFKKIKNQ